ncbi:TPA: hypothetical protein EYP70_05970 [Candidatus Bathyarchaeota archaeon]|nr:hypothetical protein [Candidatus Bathyarchaeota archaeon]
MQPDWFDLELKFLDKEDEQYIKNLLRKFPDQSVKVRIRKGGKVTLRIPFNPEGLWVLKMLIQKFYPWMEIFAVKQLLKADFPKALWNIPDVWSGQTRDEMIRVIENWDQQNFI